MVEIDADKFGMRDVIEITRHPLGELTRKYWYHFASLIAILVIAMLGYSPIM